jgi:hypothetical protein
MKLADRSSGGPSRWQGGMKWVEDYLKYPEGFDDSDEATIAASTTVC